MFNNGYIEMRKKKGKEIVRVYNISNSADGKTSYATCWTGNPRQSWETVKLSSLVPMDYIWEDGTSASKTEKNKIKERLILQSASWKCTDGTVFESETTDGHTGLSLAIEYEKK